MNILIINAHSDNRGDEAAIKAMTDELLRIYPNARIVISYQGKSEYHCMDKQIKQIRRFPVNESKKDQISFLLSIFTRGLVAFTKDGREFLQALKVADIVLHAPGGPSLGDIYAQVEWLYLWRLDLVRRLKKPYMFYAPSMGPFTNKKNDKLRRKVIAGAKRVVLRDPISVEYLKEYMPDIKVELTMDSAFQHDLSEQRLEIVYNNYKPLTEFLSNHEKNIGVTITDLKWHPIYGKTELSAIIEQTFKEFISEKVENGYGIVFIPQLFGGENDYDLMSQYMQKKDTFIVDAANPEYDAYFQQYLIGRLYAVIGMRYHSNIFSAKMGTPFISISYEQKMIGFMKSAGLEKYCISINNISVKEINDKFELLEKNYDKYKTELNLMHNYLKEKSLLTTYVVKELLDNR